MSVVNQENRIKLMLASAKAALTAETEGQTEAVKEAEELISV